MNPAKLRTGLQARTAEVAQTAEKLQQTYDAAMAEKAVLEEAVTLARTCVQQSIDRRKFFEDIVTSGFRQVYGPDYDFALEPEYDTKTDVLKGLKMTLTKHGHPSQALADDHGSGPSALIDSEFRMGGLLVSPDTVPLFVGDEPGGEIDDAAWAAWLEVLCDLTAKWPGFQIIMTTHHSSQAGKVYLVTQDSKGVSRAEVIDAEED